MTVFISMYAYFVPKQFRGPALGEGESQVMLAILSRIGGGEAFLSLT